MSENARQSEPKRKAVSWSATVEGMGVRTGNARFEIRLQAGQRASFYVNLPRDLAVDLLDRFGHDGAALVRAFAAGLEKAASS